MARGSERETAPAQSKGGVITRRGFVGCLAGVAALGAASAANGAERVDLLLVSRKRLLTETRQARALSEAETQLSAELQRRIDEIKAELGREEQELARMRGSLDRSVFQAKITAFDRKVRKERRRAQQYAANLRNAFRAEKIKLAAAVRPVLLALLAEKGASAILDADTALAFDPALDVTDEAIARFNATVPMPAVPDLEALAPREEEGTDLR